MRVEGGLRRINFIGGFEDFTESTESGETKITTQFPFNHHLITIYHGFNNSRIRGPFLGSPSSFFESCNHAVLHAHDIAIHCMCCALYVTDI